MFSFRRLLAALLLISGAAFAPVHAAESYDNCTGFINSLPTTITTQGVWCLDKNLSTAITSGNAITIAANNVTIDCNDFKIGGLGGGNLSIALGIYAYYRQNATIRNCAIRGFYRGIYLKGGAGHLVEDNRLDNNLVDGIYVTGDNNRVQRNAIYDTGGRLDGFLSRGITAEADIIGNTVSGMFTDEDNSSVYGIGVYGVGNEASRNNIRGLLASRGGQAWGIWVGSDNVTVADNRISAVTDSTNGDGIFAHGGANTFCARNTVLNFDSAYEGCDHTFGNLPATP